MKRHWLTITKTLVKSSLDNYILPGTLTGTEILLVYMTEWKRHVLSVTSVTFYLLSSQIDLPLFQRVISSNSEEAPEPE